VGVRYETVRIAELDERYGSLRLAKPEVVAALRRSVERHGVMHPILVNGLDGARWAVLDGFKRVRVARELGAQELAARVVELDEAAAQAAMVTSNTPHRGLSELEEAWVVRSLVRKCKVKQADVAELLGRHKSWVCRRLLLVERLEESIQEDMRLGLVGATVARELARLPRGNQTAVAACIQKHELTSRQGAELVDRYLLSPSEEAFAEVLADPLAFLRRDDDPGLPADPRLTARGEQLRRMLIRLDGAAASLAAELRKHPPGCLGELDQRVLTETVTSVVSRTREAVELLGPLVSLVEETHAGA